MNERELVSMAQEGDAGAFEQLVMAKQKMIYNYCFRMVGDREDALDLTQEVFLRAYKSLVFFKAESSFTTWIYRLAGNACIDFLRKNSRKKTVSLYVVNNEGEEDIMQIPDGALPPDKQAERRESCEAIARGLNLLGNDQRQILILREINGLSYGEIAEALEISEGTVKSRLSRARRELCGYLNTDGNFSGDVSSEKMKRG